MKKQLASTLALLPLACMAQDKPNVIVLYIDDMGIGDVSCYGGKITPTPNIDRLAEQGIRFEQYYSAAPVSSPSRVAVTTGQYPIRHHINTFLSSRKHNQLCEQEDFLKDTSFSMAKAFKQAGYATAHIGKWHMGGGRDVKNAPSILNYGFDECVSTYESPNPDPLLTSTNWIWAATDSIKRWNRTAYFCEKALDFITRQHGKPFFLNLWPDDVHSPWIPEDMADEKKAWYAEKGFTPVMAEMDRVLGEFFNSLEQLGVADNTIIIFTSDNGPSPSFQRKRTMGLRGTKNSLYEGGIRMPFIVRYPQGITPGQINKETVLCATDLYPTLCAMTGIHPEKDFRGDGEDFSQAVLGKQSPERTTDLMWDFGRNKQYFKFAKELEAQSPHLAIRRGNLKLLCNGDGSDIQLYDLSKDKFETKNIANQYPKLVKELQQKICKWFEENKIKKL
ncbi:sulfatase [Bacteroides sp.]|uniref:sulfatase family protein n=1 Tax=Bacteroides sp. TaxID=29523 RepID=UPI003A8CBF44